MVSQVLLENISFLLPSYKYFEVSLTENIVLYGRQNKISTITGIFERIKDLCVLLNENFCWDFLVLYVSISWFYLLFSFFSTFQIEKLINHLLKVVKTISDMKRKKYIDQMFNIYKITGNKDII